MRTTNVLAHEVMQNTDDGRGSAMARSLGGQLNGWTLVVLAVAGGLVTSPMRAAVVVKANNTTALNQPASWTNGVVPGSVDVAVWDSTVTAARTVSLGADLSWSGIQILNPVGSQTLNAGNTLTLGAAGVDMSAATTNLTVNAAIALAADQAWNAGARQFNPWGAVALDGHQLSLSGTAVKFAGAITGAGTLAVVGGTSSLSNGAAAPNATVRVNASGTLVFDTASGAVAGARVLNASLDGGTLSITANTTVNTTDTVANALTVDALASKLTLKTAAGHSMQVHAGNLARNPGAVALFAGTSLGQFAIASSTANSANIGFDSAPTLVGAGGAAGTTTNSILVGVYGDTNANNNGFGATGGLATYDGVNGIRVLNPITEYAASITDGQSQLDNVRLANTSGSGVLTTTFAQPLTTVNALAIYETGVGTNSGVTVTGSASTALKIGSGVILASQACTVPAASDVMLINAPVLDLNGQEGVILASTAGNGASAYVTVAPLEIDSAITNATGLTLSGGGELLLAGATTNTYTGTTTVNGGQLVLNKTVSNASIPGDLVLNSGWVIFKSNNQIADAGSVTINGGNFSLAAPTTGSAWSETISNLTFAGGSMSYASGRKVAVTVNGWAHVSAGTLLNSQSGTLTVNGLATLNGGQVQVQSAYDASSVQGVAYLNGGLLISNTVSGVYTAVVVKAGGTAGYKSGNLVLGGGVTCRGNPSNANAVQIAAGSGLGDAGVITLSGTRTFDIDDGPAPVDLVIMPPITTATGVVTKAGAGALGLSGANSFTGPTTIGNGTLVLNGSLRSPVTVCSNAVLTGTGWVTTNTTALAVNAGGIVDPGSVGGIGTISVTGNVSFASGAILRVDLDPTSTNADLLAVSGNVLGSGNVVTVSARATSSNTGPWKILTASNIAPSFATGCATLKARVLNNNTELWLISVAPGTVMFFQ